MENSDFEKQSLNGCSIDLSKSYLRKEEFLEEIAKLESFILRLMVNCKDCDEFTVDQIGDRLWFLKELEQHKLLDRKDEDQRN